MDRPHELIPLLLFGVVATPTSIVKLLESGTNLSLEMASMVAMFGMLALVLGVIEYWHHG